MLKKKLNKKGFTLIELLAVIIILAIIMIIAIPMILGIINRSREDSFKRTAQAMGRAASIQMGTSPNAVSDFDRVTVGGQPWDACWLHWSDLDMETDNSPFGGTINMGHSGVRVRWTPGGDPGNRVFVFDIVLQDDGGRMLTDGLENNCLTQGCRFVERRQLAADGNADVQTPDSIFNVTQPSACWTG